MVLALLLPVSWNHDIYVSGLKLLLICLPVLVGIRTIASIYNRKHSNSRTKLPLPPGPPGRPWVGNAADMPKHHEWETVDQWRKIYGDVVYVNSFGQSTIYLNSHEAAWDLLEKRSSIYSSRHDFPMMNDLMGYDWNFAFMKYGDRWRQHRKIFHHDFHANVVSQYKEKQLKHARILINNLGKSPEQFYKHALYLASSVIMDCTYGLDILDEGDPLMHSTEEGLKAMGIAGIPGAFIVDMFPSLKYLPHWMPGADFKKRAREWRKHVVAMAQVPWDAAKRGYHSGQFSPSFASSWIEKTGATVDVATQRHLDEVGRNVAGVAFSGGSETTTSIVAAVILAMILFPEVQQKAHTELDAIVGRDRLPEWSDEENLPYMRALCKEALRWMPVVPLGIAHRVTEDDVYKGMFIPNGAVVIGNAWSILRDENRFGPDPDAFNPDRFLKPGVAEPVAAFGFGRRICPGRHFAENTLFIAVSSMLHVFKIGKAFGDDGQEVPIPGTFTSGMLCRPDPFQCSIVPRTEGLRKLCLK
ncbi:cytochrome P450 [Ramaria rubella]|nr:cytochrome P450 [Ramaria rubella]